MGVVSGKWWGVVSGERLGAVSGEMLGVVSGGNKLRLLVSDKMPDTGYKADFP